jgi:hypothetical protein
VIRLDLLIIILEASRESGLGGKESLLFQGRTTGAGERPPVRCEFWSYSDDSLMPMYCPCGDGARLG